MANKRRPIEFDGKMLHVRDDLYRRPYRKKNGMPGNAYYILTKCDVCGKDYYRAARNHLRKDRADRACCSPDCQYKHKPRKQKIQKKRNYGSYHVLILDKAHPAADRHGRVYEHRAVMEEKLGRLLLPNERIHHINMIKNDNAPSNLFLFSMEQEHFAAHGSLNQIVAGLINDGIILFDKEKKIYRRIL